MSTSANDFGRFGWFSVLGFVVLGLLAVLDSSMALDWPLSVGVTTGLAVLAGIGALLLWFGNDPTASERRTRT